MAVPVSGAAQAAFDECLRIARDHYENFPVASLLIPRSHRGYVAAVYAFARTADDFADEGNRTPEERLLLLDGWQQKLDDAALGTATDPIFVAVAETIARTSAPKALFDDLLVAFRMDASDRRYATYDELLGYCRHSANPVGRLLLHFFGYASDEALRLSDNICTALQLTNFLQDVSVDLKKPRFYLPLEDFERFGYTEAELSNGVVNEPFRALVAFQVWRIRQLFSEGRRLLDLVGMDLRREVTMTWLGGMKILDMIMANDGDVLTLRPALTRRDIIPMLARTLLGRV